MHSTIAAPELSMQLSQDWGISFGLRRGEGRVVNLQLNHCDFLFPPRGLLRWWQFNNVGDGAAAMYGSWW